MWQHRFVKQRVEWWLSGAGKREEREEENGELAINGKKFQLGKMNNL